MSYTHFFRVTAFISSALVVTIVIVNFLTSIIVKQQKILFAAKLVVIATSLHTYASN